jgi:hypothetical protein
MASTFFSRERSAERMRNVPFFRYIFFIILLLLLVQILFPAWRILPLIYGQGTVPLHYNIHFGVDSLGAWWRIFTVPLIGLLFLVINTIVAQTVWKREPMLAYLVVSATLLFEFFLFLAMVFIVLLNISYG